MQILSRQVATEAGLQTIDTPDGWEVCIRADHMVLANHTNEPGPSLASNWVRTVRLSSLAPEEGWLWPARGGTRTTARSGSG